MARFRVLFVLLAVLVLAGCWAGDIYVPPTLTPLTTSGPSGPAATVLPAGQGTVATIETERGTIVCVLRPDAAPKTVANFVKLANEGFYDGLTFFRVEPNFVIQGGSPDNTATGSIGYTIEAEIGLPHNAGALAMARTADQVNPERRSDGSQFYITLAATPHLDGAYTVFGDCSASLKVVQSIQVGDRMLRVRVETR